MNMNVKPFRLINHSELSMIQQQFNNKLQLWNDEYAQFPLTCELSLTTIQDKPHQACHCISTQQRPIALMINNDLSMIRYCLFGDTADCFHGVSHAIFLKLVQTLLDSEALQIELNLNQPEAWFYTGSPSLHLKLQCNQDESISFFLHPQWVINALPQHSSTLKPTCSLDTLFDPYPVKLEIELNPTSLTLAEITQLEVGDVIKTDHPITSPLRLKHTEKTICHVHLGEHNHTHTIQITRPL